jgi:hypothetical protein
MWMASGLQEVVIGAVEVPLAVRYNMDSRRLIGLLSDENHPHWARENYHDWLGAAPPPNDCLR